MELLSEDPTYLAGALGLCAGAFLVALRATQQGKYLIWASVLFGLAMAVVVVEQAWVTDNERIEATVYALGRAVADSDDTRALDTMTDDVQYVTNGHATPGSVTREMVKGFVANSKVEFLRITHLRANAGGQSRRGTAEFQVISGGHFNGGVASGSVASANSSWSLGLRETSPGVWKVNRIAPTYLPGMPTQQASSLHRPNAPRPSPPPEGVSGHRGLGPWPNRVFGGRRLGVPRSPTAEIDMPPSIPAPFAP